MRGALGVSGRSTVATSSSYSLVYCWASVSAIYADSAEPIPQGLEHFIGELLKLASSCKAWNIGQAGARCGELRQAKMLARPFGAKDPQRNERNAYQRKAFPYLRIKIHSAKPPAGHAHQGMSFCWGSTSFT